MIRKLRNENEYEDALQRVYDLIQIDRTEVETDEMEALSILIKEYEDKYYPMLPPIP